MEHWKAPRGAESGAEAQETWPGKKSGDIVAGGGVEGRESALDTSVGTFLWAF